MSGNNTRAHRFENDCEPEHDDDARESAYDRDFKLSPLTDTLDRAGEFGITVVSVKEDWAQVFPPN